MSSRSRYLLAVVVTLAAFGAAMLGSGSAPTTVSAEDPYHNQFPFECGTYEAQLYGCGGNSGCYYYGYGCGPAYGCDPYYQGHGCGSYTGCDKYYVGPGCGSYGYCDPYYDDDHDCYGYCDGYYDHDDDDYDHCYYNPYPGFLSVIAARSTINCGSTTTITVNLHLPHPHASGVTVGLSHNVPGVLKPGGLQQSVNGKAVFSYTAPPDWNGPVLIGASTEYEAANLTIQVNCKTGNPPVPQI